MLARNDTSSDVMQQGSSTVTLSGPLWTGPLHNGSDIQEMIEMANGWGWIENGKGSGEKSRSKEEVSANQKLRELLDIMLEESDPNLQVGYIELDEVLQSSCYFQAAVQAFYQLMKNHLLFWERP
jgi:tRNA (guanine26-N2/guanine27-N2)-dimethyltransferase